MSQALFSHDSRHNTAGNHRGREQGADEETRYAAARPRVRIVVWRSARAARGACAAARVARGSARARARAQRRG